MGMLMDSRDKKWKKKRLGATYLLFTYKRADYRWPVNDEREIKNDQ